jgi:hypothetical protein
MIEILDDARNIKLKPYIYLQSGEIQNLLPLLDENDIAYKIEKIRFNSELKSILPLNSNQLDEMDSIIHISENQLHFVEQFLDKSMPIENSLTEKIKTPHEYKINWKILIGTIIFVVILGVQSFFHIYSIYGTESFFLVPSPWRYNSIHWLGGGGLF